MNDEQDNESYRLIAWILAIAVTIAIVAAVLPAILLAMNPSAPSSPAAATSAATTTATTTATSAATSAATAADSAATTANARATVVGPAKIFFASGKLDVAADSADKLKPIVDAIKAGSASKAIVSGYHDKTGNPDQNAELAKNRAKAVRDELIKAGLADGQVELQKPQETEGSSNDQEARRVEVTAVK